MFNIDVVGKASVKESSLHVEAHDFEVIVVGKGKEDSDTSKLNDRGIGFPIVLRSLAKALGNQSCLFLASNDGSIRVIFIVKRLSDTNGFAAMWERCTFESVSGFQAIILSLHCSQPHGVVRSVNGFVVRVWRLSKVPGTVS